MDAIYYFENIRVLLLEGFTETELRRFCHDTREYQAIYNTLAENANKEKIVDQLLTYGQRHLKLENLLHWAETQNPGRYIKHQPYQIESNYSSSGNKLKMYYHYKESTYPDTYRQQDIQCLLDTICLQRSARVAGLSGMGKSNLLRFLVSHPHLLENHPRFPAKSVYFLHVDCNRLNPASPYRFYQACNRLMQVQYPLTDDVQQLHSQLSQSLSALPQDVLVILVIDRIEQLYEVGGEAFFNQLRSLRDDARSGRMIFIVGSQRPVGYLFELEKLFSDICWVGPLTSLERKPFFQRHQTRLNIIIDEAWQQVLWQLTGGHPGFLKNSLEWWLRYHQQVTFNQTDEIINSLLAYKPIERYCVRLWENLTQAEQHIILDLANTPRFLKSNVVDFLQQTGLVLQNQPGLTLFNLLWRTYLIRPVEEVGGLLKITSDTNKHRVRIQWGRQIKETVIRRKSVFILLSVLARTPGEVCRDDDLLKAIYGEEASYHTSDNALSQLVSALRSILGPLIKRYVLK